MNGTRQEVVAGAVLTVVDDDPTPREGRVIPFDRAVRVIEGEQKVLGFFLVLEELRVLTLWS